MIDDTHGLLGSLFGPVCQSGPFFTQTRATPPALREPTLSEMAAALEKLDALNLKPPEPIELTAAQWEAVKRECQPHLRYTNDAGCPSQLFGLQVILKDG